MSVDRQAVSSHLHPEIFIYLIFCSPVELIRVIWQGTRNSYCSSKNSWSYSIHISHCRHLCASYELFHWGQNIWQLNFEVIAIVSSQLCNVECGDIFFASQTTSGMKKPNCRDTKMFSFSKVKMQSLKEIEEGTNHIASELYHVKTDRVRNRHSVRKD